MPKKFIHTVSVTGADDSTRHEDLFALAEKYPFAEFAILLSRSSAGRHRFPSREWLAKLAEMAGTTKKHPLRLAGHLCGAWVREVYLGSWPAAELDPALVACMGRWQINTHGEAHRCKLDGLMGIVAARGAAGQQVIFQFDKVNTEPVVEAARLGLNASALLDLSHGTGLLPEDWDYPSDPKTGRPLSIPCGFAGGLSPENVVEQIAKMEGATGGRSIWIDAETHLRSNGDALFDLAKAEAFLQAARPWVLDGKA